MPPTFAEVDSASVKTYSKKALQEETDSARARDLAELERRSEFDNLRRSIPLSEKKRSTTENYFLGRVHQYGLGVPADLQKAISIYSLPSQVSHAPSLMCWAEALLQSSDAEQTAKAVLLLKKAAKLNPLYGS